MTIRVLMLTKYARAGASSRVRMMDWIAPLEPHGFAFDVRPLLSDVYVRRLYDGGRTDWADIARGYARRLADAAAMRRFDLVWVEKELLPYVPWLERLLLAAARRPLVIDIDDAVFHYYDRSRHAAVRALLGRKIDHVFARSALVLAGNSYLAARAVAAGARRVEILPTVVEAARYTSRPWPEVNAGPMRIGWIGSPATQAYLGLIAGPLTDVRAATGATLTLIGARPEAAAALDAQVLAWSVESEVRDLQTFDVGIMPLPDEPFERGKCGFKLVQYMACGLPTVASPVGVNVDIVEHGLTGFLADTAEEWRAALLRLAGDPALRATMGRAGRGRFEAGYSREGQTARVAGLLRMAAKGRENDPRRSSANT